MDVQNDFCPGGALGVDGGDQLGAVIAEAAAGAGTLVATRDMHPADHISFREQGGPWPPHCVAGTPGAELHPSVAGLSFDIVHDKGRDPAREQYSDFDDSDLADRLRERGVTHVVVAGLATDYCVRATALDAIAAGFETTVLRDAIAAVDVEPGDGERALREIRAAGGTLDRVHLLRGRERLAPILEAKVRRLREVVEGAGRSRAALGLSGGIDSALSLAIAARALGPENVYAITLPSRHTEQVHIDDARACAAAAGLPDANFMNVSIEPILEGIVAARPTVHDAPLRFGNASARARMITIYDLAQERDALVLGTENRSEYYLGYFTRFGDAASDVEPIWDLYKTEVKLASEMMGQPEAVLIKHPDGRAVGRPDRRGRARLHLPRRRPGDRLPGGAGPRRGRGGGPQRRRPGGGGAGRGAGRRRRLEAPRATRPVNVDLDHTVVTVSDWERSNAFYRDVLGAEVVPRGPVVAYRFGDRQLNVHGPGFDAFPLPLHESPAGSSDICFVWDGPIEAAVAHLAACGVAVELGPVQRDGARGIGTSVYFRDPDGSLLELISYSA